MSEVITTPRAKINTKTERPRLYKVILINDDFTPREFVVTVLKKVFRMSEAQAYPVMLTAHRRGACVVAVFAKDIAESKAQIFDLGRRPRLCGGRPRPQPAILVFSTEPEEQHAGQRRRHAKRLDAAQVLATADLLGLELPLHLLMKPSGSAGGGAPRQPCNSLKRAQRAFHAP